MIEIYYYENDMGIRMNGMIGEDYIDWDWNSLEDAMEDLINEYPGNEFKFIPVAPLTRYP